MNANELRIGNKFECMGMIQTVFELCDNTNRGEIKQVGYEYIIRCEENENQYKPIEINPIPLTEEWLLRFGFTKGNVCYKRGYSMDILKTDFYLRPSYSGGFYWGFNISDEKMDCELNDVRAIEYIHQLQNLIFAITGEELKINLS